MQKMKITLFAIILMVALAAAYADTAELNYTSGDVTIGLICGDVGTNVEAPPMAPGGAFDARILVDGVYYFEYYFNGEDADIALTTQAFVDGGEEQEITMDFVLTGYEVFYIGQDSLEVGGDPVPVVPGTITIDPDPISPFVTQTVVLNPGWNLVSFNVNNEVTTITEFFAPIAGNFDIIATFINGSYQTYNAMIPVHPWDVMDLQYGYWVHITSAEAQELDVTGTQIPASQSIDLINGWNLMSYYPTAGNSITSALSPISGDFDIVAAFINGGYQTYNAMIPVHPWDSMEQGLGYWINITNEAGTQLTYNTISE